MWVMTIKQAKEMDMVNYLSRIGYEPSDIRGNQYWYKSPLRDEADPSFKVNRKMNRWYDFADGKGGNLVDFGILYHGCSISDFLQKLDSPALTVAAPKQTVQHTNIPEDEKNRIEVLTVKPITSLPLISYLDKRRIAREIAHQYCREVTYRLNDKNYYAIGFKNDAGGYELRNEYIKAASSPKDITFINNNAKDIATFEGYFNFLSYKTMYHKQEEPKRNFLVLNSASFFEKSLPLMQSHEHASLYLDNDKTGNKFTEMAIKLDKQKFSDERLLYRNHNDLNDWQMHIGQQPKQRLRQQL
jgi:DNA primase